MNKRVTLDDAATPTELVLALRALRRQRSDLKDALKSQSRRGQLSPAERETILRKTGKRCHICGGEVNDAWQADHVLAHSGGGVHSADNYLPAHAVCNNYRWDYLADEFQYILKLGVWVRTQIEHQTKIGHQIAALFLRHEAGRRKRRRSDHGTSEPTAV